MIQAHQASVSGAVLSRTWWEFAGGVISGLFGKPRPALERRWRSRHDEGYHIGSGRSGRDIVSVYHDGNGPPSNYPPGPIFGVHFYSRAARAARDGRGRHAGVEEHRDPGLSAPHA